MGFNFIDSQLETEYRMAFTRDYDISVGRMGTSYPRNKTRIEIQESESTGPTGISYKTIIQRDLLLRKLKPCEFNLHIRRNLEGITELHAYSQSSGRVFLHRNEIENYSQREVKDPVELKDGDLIEIKLDEQDSYFLKLKLQENPDDWKEIEAMPQPLQKVLNYARNLTQKVKERLFGLAQ